MIFELNWVTFEQLHQHPKQYQFQLLKHQLDLIQLVKLKSMIPQPCWKRQQNQTLISPMRRNPY